MHFTLPKKDFESILAAVQGLTVKGQNGSMILVDLNDSRLRVLATDGEQTVIVDKVDGFTRLGFENDAVMVDGRHLFQVVKALPDAIVEFSVDEKFKVSIDCGPAHYKLNGASTANAPVVPPFESRGSLTMKTADLRRIIEQTAFCIPADDNRYGLNGMHLEMTDGKLRAVTTDGSRLAYANADFEGEFKMTGKTLLPRASVQRAAKLPGEVITIEFGDRAMLFRAGEMTFHTRLVDGEFPPYKRVLPSGKPEREVAVNREELLTGLRRVALEARDKASTVRVEFTKDDVQMSARSIEHGEASHPVACSMVGTPIAMGFNVNFWLDALGAIEDENVVVKLGEALAPCVLVPAASTDQALFVIMPIRLD